MTHARKRPSTRRTSLKLIAGSLAAAAAISGGLAVQMAHGRDPGLGSGSSNAQIRAAPQSDPQSATSPSTVVTRAS